MKEDQGCEDLNTIRSEEHWNEMNASLDYRAKSKFTVFFTTKSFSKNSCLSLVSMNVFNTLSSMQRRTVLRH